jgi:multidrug resistance protein MdtO
MNPSALIVFLRRELSPISGRGRATFRLTLACLIATIPIMTHHIPHALIVMIIMYLVTQEDTAATLIGSILALVGWTVGSSFALFACEVSIDNPGLRLCFFAAFLFGGLFLKRILIIGALGSAIGLPAALVMILPDILPPKPEVLVEFVLWLWWCVALGLAVNVAVQLLLSPGDPLILLRRELDDRLLAVGHALRRLAGREAPAPATPLTSLATAGMSRPLALLKTASLLHHWAREHHEVLAALITFVDRLVTAAVALTSLAPFPAEEIGQERLVRVADGCDRMRRAFQEFRRPDPAEWVALATERGDQLLPLTDIEGTLDEIVQAVPSRSEAPDPPDAAAGERHLFLPDAFTNREYVRFAVKGALSAFICYVLFIGFDYPGIYTSVITCFVVSLSTIGSSNQKGLLRFGGAIAGGVMGLIALVYLFPNVESIGGFWLVFGAGTAIAAWVNFGTPRISYAGYQTGLAFYKATLQGFGPAISATVVRDRLIGVFFGLIVFGIVEHVLWPVRAIDALRARIADTLLLLAALARAEPNRDTEAAALTTVDAWRRRILQAVADVQGLIESSKFEQSPWDLDALQRRIAEAQIVFLLLLSLARHRWDIALPDTVQARVRTLDTAIAGNLEALATRITGRPESAAPDLDNALGALERSIADAADSPAAPGLSANAASLPAFYRPLVTALGRLATEPVATVPSAMAEAA